MSKKKNQKRKRVGHYCWSCDSYRPNERFSGKGHRRHLCRECSKLGSEELNFRQALRDLERCVTWEGFIRRKRRKLFEQFLNHDDPRIRSYALELQADDPRTRMRDAEEEFDEELDLGEISEDASEIPF